MSAAAPAQSPPPGNLSSTLDQHIGFHFSLATVLLYHRPAHCSSLHLHYVLPHGLFVDPYELDLRTDAYTYSLSASPDLERPVSAVEHHETSLQLTLAPSAVKDHGRLELAVPIHGRYGLPSYGPREEAYMALKLPPPTAFWRCGESGTSFPCFLPVLLRLTFAAIDHTIVPLVTSSPLQDIPLLVPVGMAEDVGFVEGGTALTVLFVSAYLLYVFSRVYSRLANDVYESKKE